ncbi:MAG: carbamoyltransferase HypF [Deltaproteobacteria bacterium]|nr:carbamoyltransferase HypF [Deltaproteobacteria bacterium]
MHFKKGTVNNKRVRHYFSGIVQGVGFRPFIYRLAVQNGLTGFVRNRTDGVIAEVEGEPAALDSFLAGVHRELPPLAHMTQMASEEIAVRHDPDFRIIESDARGPADVHMTPDAAICPDCLRELFDQTNRRFRYPFINCTNCGPRLTIIRTIPYDRANTSLACFPLCPQCRAEYENPADRRFHAEPNACPVCGPRLTLLDREGEPVETVDPAATAVDLLSTGHVLAIKGLGGFHLCVDAASDEAVKKLRSRKYREEKPLAVMARDIDRVRQMARVSPEEEALLISSRRPIVLLQKIKQSSLSEAVAPGVPNLGVMLPYTPLHHLLLSDHFTALVMTSANQVDEPICIGNRESVQRLKHIADYFLVHNRDILVRCDDSIVFAAAGSSQLLRRSRGFVPQPLRLREEYPPVLALGGQMKTAHCILKGHFAFVSPHIGDMETPQARDFFNESLALMKKITESDPQTIACDLHPAYYSTQAANELAASRVISVQHHHAHVVSCMADNHIEGAVIGLAMDGTGYGPDGQAWGGEFLIADETGFQRFGHLRYLVLPGGEKAIREPWRIAISLLRIAYGPPWKEMAMKLKLITDETQGDVFDKIIEREIHSPLSSGLGRLFDGVAALIGVRKCISYEGQAAMELEALAAGASGSSYPFDLRHEETEPAILDMSAAVRALVSDLHAGKSRAKIAASFHQTLIDALAGMSGQMRQSSGLSRVVLSGGCFQNKILLEGTMNQLKRSGFDVYCHRRVPANDGGISLGQAVIAGSIMKKGI